MPASTLSLRLLSEPNSHAMCRPHESLIPPVLRSQCRHDCKPPRKLRQLFLFPLALSIFSVGCSTPRHTIARARSISTVHDCRTEAIAASDDSRVCELEASPIVRAAAHQAVVDSVESGDTIQDAVTLQSESIPLPRDAKSEDGLSLDAIEHLALANNPAIKQASAASARAGGIRTQVGLKPNPLLGFNGAQVGDDGTDQYSIFVEQTFVRGNKLAWNRRVIGHDVNAMNWMIETQRERILTDVRLAFYGVLAAQKRLELSNEFRTVAEKGVSISEAQMKAAVGTKPDVLQSEIQLNEVDLAIQQAEYDYLAAWNELVALVGIPNLARTSLVGTLEAADVVRNEENEYDRIVAISPSLAAAQARVCRAKANLQRQRVQPVPNVTAQLGVGHDLATDHEFANVILSVPVPVHNKNQGNIRAAYAEYCAATQNVDRIRLSIRRDLARVMREYQVAEVSVRQYEQNILPKAKEVLDLIAEAREVGEFDFLRVLTARRAYFDANIKYVEALGQLAQANAKMDGLLLTGGLADAVYYERDDGLRSQALSGQ